jgi:hypothetical protein
LVAPGREELGMDGGGIAGCVVVVRRVCWQKTNNPAVRRGVLGSWRCRNEE